MICIGKGFKRHTHAVFCGGKSASLKSYMLGWYVSICTHVSFWRIFSGNSFERHSSRVNACDFRMPRRSVSYFECMEKLTNKLLLWASVMYASTFANSTEIVPTNLRLTWDNSFEMMRWWRIKCGFLEEVCFAWNRNLPTDCVTIYEHFRQSVTEWHTTFSKQKKYSNRDAHAVSVKAKRIESPTFVCDAILVT